MLLRGRVFREHRWGRRRETGRWGWFRWRLEIKGVRISSLKKIVKFLKWYLLSLLWLAISWPIALTITCFVASWCESCVVRIRKAFGRKRWRRFLVWDFYLKRLPSGSLHFSTINLRTEYPEAGYLWLFIREIDYWSCLTWRASSSTGVSRPNMETITLSFPFVVSISEIAPSKPLKGPSMIEITSPIS